MSGANGSNGSNGSSGRDGTNGIDGTDGIDGIDGADGATGPQGPAGPVGPPGPQGIEGVYPYGNFDQHQDEDWYGWAPIWYRYESYYGNYPGGYPVYYTFKDPGDGVNWSDSNNWTMDDNTPPLRSYSSYFPGLADWEIQNAYTWDDLGWSDEQIVQYYTDYFNNTLLDVDFTSGVPPAGANVMTGVLLPEGVEYINCDGADLSHLVLGTRLRVTGTLDVNELFQSGTAAELLIESGALDLHGGMFSGQVTLDNGSIDMDGNAYLDKVTSKGGSITGADDAWINEVTNISGSTQISGTMNESYLGNFVDSVIIDGGSVHIGSDDNQPWDITLNGGSFTFSGDVLNSYLYMASKDDTSVSYILEEGKTIQSAIEMGGGLNSTSDLTVNGTVVADWFYVGARDTAEATVNQYGDVHVNYGLYLPAAGDGTYNLMAGTLSTPGGIYLWDGGKFSMQGGTINDDGIIDVEGNSEFLVQNGTINETVSLDVCYGGKFSMEGGTANTPYVNLHDNGVFDHNDGTINIGTPGSPGTLSVEDGSEYNISADGVLNLYGNISLNGADPRPLELNGTVNIYGNGDQNVVEGVSQIIVGTDDDEGTVNLKNGKLIVAQMYVGKTVIGTFAQSGGVVELTGNSMYIGYETGSSGTYTLNNGTLTDSSDVYIGYLTGSIGEFIQSGTADVNISGNTYIGYRTGSSGEYAITGGTLDVGGNIYVGYDGSGTFAEEGGDITVANSVNVGVDDTDATGILNISGGTFTAKEIVVGKYGDGTLTQDGGNVLVTGNAEGSNRILVAQLGASTGAYNLNGGLVEADQIDFYGGSASDFTMTGGTLMVDKFGDSDLSHNQDLAQSGGTIAPGDSINGSSPIPTAGIGKTTIYGNYIQSVAGKIVFDVDLTSLNLNPQAGVDYDQVYVQDDYTRSAGTYEIRFSGDIANLDANNHYYLLRADDVTNDTQYWQQYFTFYLNDIPFTPDGWVVERVAGGSEELDLHWLGEGEGDGDGDSAENTTPKSTTGSSPQSLDAEIWTDISAELTLSVDYASVVLTTGGNGLGDFLDGITGGIITGNHTWTVRSNNSSGYTLKLKEKDSLGNNGAMVNQADGSYKFSPISNSSPGAWPSLSAGETGFGYSASNKTGSTNTYSNGFGSISDYVKVTTSDYEIMNSDGESALSGDTVRLNWKAQFVTGGGKFLKTGTYKEFVTVTAETK